MAHIELAPDLLQPSFTRLVTATVREASSDVAVCELPDGTSARLPVTAFYPNRSWSVGGTYHLAVSDGAGSPVLSAAAPELISMLLDGLSPEVRDGRVRVMAVARQVGVRSKVAVAATVPGVDPVGACLGRAANRIKALSAMLLGERVDVVAYHPDPVRFLANALAVVPESVETTDEGFQVHVPRHQLTAAKGGGNLNVVLASRLLGTRIEVL